MVALYTQTNSPDADRSRLTLQLYSLVWQCSRSSCVPLRREKLQLVSQYRAADHPDGLRRCVFASVTDLAMDSSGVRTFPTFELCGLVIRSFTIFTARKRALLDEEVRSRLLGPPQHPIKLAD